MADNVAELRELRRLLRRRRAGWSASLRALLPERKGDEVGESPLGCGLIFDDRDLAPPGAAPIATLLPSEDVTLPRKISWRRARRRRWVSPVRNQGSCNACVAFGICDVMEASHRLQHGLPWKTIDLSEGELFDCGGGTCEGGWYFGPALERAHLGVARDTDHPYRPEKRPCPGVSSYMRVTSVRTANTQTERKQLLRLGPAVGAMVVDFDFACYSDGVFLSVEPFSGAGHALTFIGYDDDQGCWLVKNSWGARWGRNGFGKISYAEPSVYRWPFYSLEVELIP